MERFFEITYVLVLLINVQLLVIVLFSGERSVQYRVFAGYLISAIVWIAAEYFAHIYVSISYDEVLALWCSRMTPIGALFAPAFGVWFSYIFGDEQTIIFSRAKKLVLFVPAFIFLLLSPTHWNIESVAVGGLGEFTAGPLFDLYFVYAGLCFFVWLPLVFYRKMRVSQGEQAVRIKLMLGGLIATAAFAIIFAIILPVFFHIQWAISFAPYAPLFFTGTALYALLKHRLFSVKVVTTQFFSGVILILLFFDLYRSPSMQDAIVNGVVFAVALAFIVLLIRSVLNEVKQKEQIETLAKGLSRANNELTDLNEHLEEKVKEQTIEIRKAYEVEKMARENLEALDEAKTDFILTTQHHLRTPLTVARGMVQMALGNKDKERFSESTARFLEKAKSAIDTLADLMNEFLDISQMEVGKSILSKKETSLHPLIKDVLRELSQDQEEKGIRIDVTFSEEAKETTLSIDQSKFRSALVNLIDNAIKYTEKEGSIMITGEIAIHPIERTKLYRLTIEDTGIGMTEEEQDKVFVRSFERGAKAKEMNATGRGLGLMLTRQIVSAHGGTIRVESEGRDKGTVFIIELPIGKRERRSPSFSS